MTRWRVVVACAALMGASSLGCDGRPRRFAEGPDEETASSRIEAPSYPCSANSARATRNISTMFNTPTQTVGSRIAHSVKGRTFNASAVT